MFVPHVHFVALEEYFMCPNDGGETVLIEKIVSEGGAVDDRAIS